MDDTPLFLSLDAFSLMFLQLSASLEQGKLSLADLQDVFGEYATRLMPAEDCKSGGGKEFIPDSGDMVFDALADEMINAIGLTGDMFRAMREVGLHAEAAGIDVEDVIRESRERRHGS